MSETHTHEHGHAHRSPHGDPGDPGNLSDHSHGAADAADTTTSQQESWNARYSEKHRIWSGNPNALLVREAADLKPGRALDLGCGEGADMIWLAHRGWHVTGVDVSDVALSRAAEHARAEGVQDLVEFQQHTLGETFPDGRFDLITAMYLHSWSEFGREEILRTAAAAVAPGGTLLIVGHHGSPAWAQDAHPGVELPTPQEVLDALRLPDGAWEIVRAEEFASPMVRPDGVPDTRPDNVVNVRRLPSSHVSEQ